MNIKRTGRYFAAVDVLNDARMREAAVYFEHELDPNHALPGDVSVRGMAEILRIRTGAVIRATGAMTCRIVGVDALYRIVVDKEFPQ